MPIGLSDTQLHEIRQAAQTVPYELRSTFLEQVAARLNGQDLGDGLAHRTAYDPDSDWLSTDAAFQTAPRMRSGAQTGPDRPASPQQARRGDQSQRSESVEPLQAPRRIS